MTIQSQYPLHTCADRIHRYVYGATAHPFFLALEAINMFRKKCFCGLAKLRRLQGVLLPVTKWRYFTSTFVQWCTKKL